MNFKHMLLMMIVIIMLMLIVKTRIYFDINCFIRPNYECVGRPFPAKHRPLQGEDDIDIAWQLNSCCDQETQVQILSKSFKVYEDDQLSMINDH